MAGKIEKSLIAGSLGLLQEQKQVPLFENYAQNWIAVTVPATCKPSTQKDYELILQHHVLPVFGKLPGQCRLPA